jgi:uncharacterized spore protein YtfJ
MSLDKLADTVLKDLGDILKSKSVVGEPLVLGGKTIVPVTKVSFGFGVGGSEEEKSKDGFGGGTAGGANIEPVSFLVIDEEKGVKVVKASYKRELWEKLLDLPQTEEVIEKLREFINEKFPASKKTKNKISKQASEKEE